MIRHAEIERAVRDSLTSCFGADLAESLGFDSPFQDDLGLDSLELLSLCATIESRVGLDTEGGTLTRELGPYSPATIRALIDVVKEVIARNAGDRRDPER